MAEEKGRFEILLEGIKGDVKLVLEGHGTIRSEMKQMKEELTEKIELVDGKVEFLAAELRATKKELKEEIVGVKQKVDKIERTLDAHVCLPVHANV